MEEQEKEEAAAAAAAATGQQRRWRRHLMAGADGQGPDDEEKGEGRDEEAGPCGHTRRDADDDEPTADRAPIPRQRRRLRPPWPRTKNRIF